MKTPQTFTADAWYDALYSIHDIMTNDGSGFAYAVGSNGDTQWSTATTTVKVPRQVARYEPYTIRRLVPRTVQSPVVLSYSDPYSVPLSLGQSSWLPTTDSSSSVAPATGTSREKVTYGEPRPATESSASDTSSAASDSSSTQSVRKIETVTPDELPEKKPAGNAPETKPSDNGKELELPPPPADAPPQA